MFIFISFHLLNDWALYLIFLIINKYNQQMMKGFLNRANYQTAQQNITKVNQINEKQVDSTKLRKKSSQTTAFKDNNQLHQKFSVSEHSDKKDQSNLQQKKQRSLILKEWQQKFYLNHILQFIFDVADRNEVYRANFIHAHIPFVVIFKLLDLQIKSSQQSYLRSVIKVLISKIKKSELKAQLQNLQLFNQFMILIANQQVKQEQLLKFLRKFINLNKQIMKGLLPYYYNYFALAVNKEIVFKGQPGELIQYTIDYKHEIKQNGQFTLADIQNVINTFEQELKKKYHSNDI